VTSRDLLDLIWIVPLLPIIGAAVLLLFGRRIGEPRAGWIGTATIALAFVWSVVTFFALHDLPADQRSHVKNIFTWLPSGGLQVKMGFLVDPLSVTFILFVTGVATLIHIFAIGYMKGDSRFPRFFAFTNLFVASMLILVLGSSFLVTFLGWEGVGLCSYLLVSFWFERRAAAVAGKKAFVTTRVGDFGFMVAMFLIFEKLGTLDYSALGKASSLANGTATAIALLLFLGAIGKSAQFPLHVWLPDAMEGPTPVSALIHAATMVTAGVFLVARAHPFFQASGDAMTVVAWIGGITALLAATVALVQPDIKRVLAYSTISQLGYMFLALGVGAYSAAVFHVVTHAFFKGTLFLGAGSVLHGNEDNQDMRIMGRFRKYMPYTSLAFVFAWLAIAGVPPFGGFWSKDEILSKAFFDHDYGVYAVGVAAALLTGFYMTRQVYLVFYGNARFRDPGPAVEPGSAPVPVVSGGSDDDGMERGHGKVMTIDEFEASEPTVSFGEPPRPRVLGDHLPHESPPIMTAPLLVLATLSVFGGLLSIPLRGIDALGSWLDPVFRDAPAINIPSFWDGVILSAISVLLGLIGIGIAISWYRRGIPAPDRDPALERLGVFGRLFGHAYYFDEGIARFVSGPARRFAEFVSSVIDARIIDGAVNGVATLVRGAAGGIRKVQSGLVRAYALYIVLGAVALLLYLLVWAGR
jgi:NADH-quinone oxidoreductase subunit L